MTWVEVSPEEVKAASIEVLALRAAGLELDPLVVELARAEPRTADWVKRQELLELRRPTDARIPGRVEPRELRPGPMRWLEGAQVRARKDIERYVLPNEKVLIATRRHWASLTGPIAKALPALLIGGWLLTLEPSNKISSAVGLFLVVVGVGYLGLCAVDWWARHFIVTSHSVLLTSGVLVRQVTLVQLRRITDLTWRETLLGRRLGYGTLRMEVAGGGRRASWPVRFLPHADTLFRSFSELLLRADNNDADRLFRSFSELLLRAEDDDDF